jgi:hypothetical protein
VRKAEREHMARVKALGCILCGRNAEVHHITRSGRRIDHFHTIPLCPEHHRTGRFGEAVHNGKRAFQKKHGDQMALLEQVRERLSAEA